MRRSLSGTCVPRGRAARGITLLELLVVLLILLMVTAAAVPIMAPALRNRQIREATRLVNAYLGAAKARAVETGRPVGVVIERFNGQPFAFTMSQVEVPPPYMGDVFGATGQVQITNAGSGNDGELPANMKTLERFNNKYDNSTQHKMSAVWFTAAFPSASFNHRLVRVGDRIQFNGQGHVYTIYGPDQDDDGVIDGGGTITLEIAYEYPDKNPYTRSPNPITLVDSVHFPWETAAVQQPTYQVFRQPVRTIAQPLTLPEGIVIDLSLSGVGDTLFNVADYGAYMVGQPAPAPVVAVDPAIFFSPTGRLEWVTQPDGQLRRPTDAVFLLLGRRELMFDITTKSQAQDIVFQNLSPVPATGSTVAPAPTEHFWITIAQQTGQVNVAEVAPHFQDYENKAGANLMTLRDVVNLTLNGDTTLNLLGARAFARQSNQGVGGR